MKEKDYTPSEAIATLSKFFDKHEAEFADSPCRGIGIFVDITEQGSAGVMCLPSFIRSTEQMDAYTSVVAQVCANNRALFSMFASIIGKTYVLQGLRMQADQADQPSTQYQA